MAALGTSATAACPVPQPGTVIRFFLNGQEWLLENPDPTLLLLDWLRSPAVGLTGSKKGCGQGGCGLCTVMLSRWDIQGVGVRHEAINACLRPVCSLDGTAITTIEGAGSVETALNPVQYGIAKENGSQCGYCTPGWTMAMTAFLAAHGDTKPTQLAIERMFDGNLCRCTGYRPILYAMRQFASDWTPADEMGCMTCLADPNVAHTNVIDAPVPPEDPYQLPLRIIKDGHTWYRPIDLSDLFILLETLPADDLKLVNGNTSIGIYDRHQEDPRHLVDISKIPELKNQAVDSDGYTLGGGVSYGELLDFLDRGIAQGINDERTLAIRYMAQRTAGTIVRNAASLAGNTMLVVRHIRQGVPFPSDMFTILVALDAVVVVGDRLPDSKWRFMPILDFARDWQTDDALKRMVIVAYLVPPAVAREYVRPYKVALREVNAHSIVNAGCRVRFDDQGMVTDAAIVLGGIGPVAFHATAAEAALKGRRWEAATLQAALSGLRDDVDATLEQWQDRRASLPDEGFSDVYRRHLAESFLYKFFIEVATATGSAIIPPAVASAGIPYQRPLSRGTQTIPFNPDKAPVGLPFIKLDAFLQATGEARYIHDLPLPPRGLNGAFVLSSRALARFVFRIPDAPLTPVDPPTLTAWLRGRFPALVALLTAQDVPTGQNNRTGVLAGQIGGTDPLLAQDQVEWYGQPMALVLAEDETDAIDIAHYIRQSCILYNDATGDPNAPAPILTIQDAKDRNSLLIDTVHPPYNHILYVMRPNSQLGWVGQTGAVTLDGSTCLIVNGTQTVGSQAHFYMETQSALVVPGERGQMTVNPSSQSPDSVQSTIAGVLGLAISSVALVIKRIGGGYGGKTTRSPFVAAPAAIAAAKLRRPVRIALRREEDMEMIGRRHPYEGGYSLAIATGEGTAPRGRILGLFLDLYSNGGATYDCSFTVMDCVQMRIDSAYMVPNWKTQGHVARTNLASNTAFRSMGLIQGILILEDAIARAAHELGMPAEAVREVNLYQPGQQSVVGTVLKGCYIAQVWQYLKQQADFDRRVAAVEDFNRQNRWRKRGIAMMPVQYGAGYNAAFLEQAGALVDIADEDGSVLVHQGGVEIGQGLATKITQVAAEILNLPMAFITMAPTDLQVVPNPVSTGASTGTGFNAEAVRVACLDLRTRLEAYCQKLRTDFGDAWCTQQHIDYWNYPDGWQAVIPNSGGRLIWQAIIGSAHFDRINLSAQSRVAIPGGDKPAENLHYTPNAPEQGVDQFTGYTYSAACSEVEIDVLTGETTVLRTDLVYDIGDTLNAAIDIGQVEGAFVQGAGYVLTEDIVIQPDGPDAGRLNSNNTWGYKLPATTTIPLQFNVGFYPRTGPLETANRDMVLGSKEVGEPPLVLAASVYLALKNAVLAARQDRGHADWFELAVPATVQRVREACLVDAGDLRI